MSEMGIYDEVKMKAYCPYCGYLKENYKNDNGDLTW